MTKLNYRSMILELKHHIPYTFLNLVWVFIVFALLTEFVFDAHQYLARDIYEVAHAIHIFISAVATAAMFWRYEKRFAKAMVVGLVGSLVICAAGDILFPYLGARLMGFPTPELHICLLEHPHTILPLAFIGSLLGIFAVNKLEGKGLAITLFSHSGHVVISITASLAYLLYFGGGSILVNPVLVFVIVLLSVVIPCTFSDIIFPVLMKNQKPKEADIGCCN